MNDRRGFSLLEVLVATSMLLVAVSALASLVALSVRANTLAGSATFVAILASGKMEELNALPWAALPPPVGDALARDVEGACDFLGADGRLLAGDLPPDAVYVRRWSVVPLPAAPDAAVVIQVRVLRARCCAVGATAGRAAASEEARLVSVRARKAE